MKKIFSPAPIWQNGGLFMVRCTLGLFLMYHGWEIFDGSKINEYLSWDAFKNSSGEFLVYFGKAGELIAGILFVLGLFTRIACLLTIGVMGYISLFLGNGIIWQNDQHAFLFVLLALAFFFAGPGTISLDHLFNKRRYL